MDKLILILILFLSCFHDSNEIVIREMHDYDFENDIKINSKYEAFDFIRSNISYKIEAFDYWQIPEETWTLKTGDCEDVCIFFMYLIETKLNIRTNLIMISNGIHYHTIVTCDNKYYCLVNFSISDYIYEGWQIVYEIPYSELMWMTFYYHDNVGKYF